ncbi:Lipase, GDSL [Corchorus capsularis]|uniref:Lipase, GDSL n=1 Tax=Corchorus capsularis TaxID=210143 RepID=A0A1R3GQL4_COCAP|nr:Lipase, GDSL [Corchorus capsularis]
MAISKQFFHISTFVLFLSFSISSAHFQDVTPHKEFDSKSSDSPSYAPSESPKSSVSSGSSTEKCSCTCPAPDASTGSGSSSSSGSGSSSGSISESSRFDASADSSFSGSSSSSGSGSVSGSSSSISPSSSPSMGPSPSDSDSSAPMGSSSSSGTSDSSSSDSSAPMGSSSSSGYDSSSSSGSDSASGSGSGDSTASGSSTTSGSISGSTDISGSGDSTASGSSTTSGSISGSTDISGSGTFTASGSSQISGSSTGSGSSDANASAGGGSSAEITASGSFEISFKFSGTFKKVFAFGDSYTDTGNAQILGLMKNFVVAFLTKVFQGINPNLNTAGRSSNGRLVIDFLCDALNISSLQPYKALGANAGANFNSGVNFAIGGATSLSGDFFSKNKIGSNLQWQGVPPGFQTQAEWYNDFLKQMACNGKSVEECKQEMGGHLIWLGQMGVDDYTRVLGSSISMRWLADVTITHISQILTTVLDSGAKNIVVQGLPPLGCIPVAKFFTPQFLKDEMGCSAIVNKAVTIHNDLLQTTLDQFRKRYPGSNIAYADYFNAYKTIVLNLGAYGFQDDSTACCGFGGGLLNFNLNILCGMAGTRPCSNPASHIHWDGIHLTEAMHKQITNLFLTKGFIKPSFDSMCSSKRPSN